MSSYVPDSTPPTTKQLEALCVALRADNATMQDELVVKNETITNLSNALYVARRDLSSAQAEVRSSKENFERQNSESIQAKEKWNGAQTQIAFRDRRIADLEGELDAAQGKLKEFTGKADNSVAMERELSQAKAEKAEMQATMDDWKQKMKEALKENRKKEQQYMATDIELRTQLKLLQEQIDKARFDLEKANMSSRPRPTSNQEVQTDAVERETPPPLVIPESSPSIPPLPLKLISSPESSSGVNAAQNFSERGDETPAATSTTTPKAPMIVTMHFCTKENWSVDTKHMVTDGMTVGQLIKNCCELINSRYGQSLDPSVMCIKTNHDKAKRFVTLSDSRELHSFAYFVKQQKEGTPIVLMLENTKA